MTACVHSVHRRFFVVNTFFIGIFEDIDILYNKVSNLIYIYNIL